MDLDHGSHVKINFNFACAPSDIDSVPKPIVNFM